MSQDLQTDNGASLPESRKLRVWQSDVPHLRSSCVSINFTRDLGIRFHFHNFVQSILDLLGQAVRIAILLKVLKFVHSRQLI